MELIAAPLRQFKTWSMILTIFLASSGLIIAMVQTFGEIELLSSTAVAGIVAFIATAAGISRLILQNIPVTTEQKTAIVAMAASQPMQADEKNVMVKIDNAIFPSTPPSTPRSKYEST